MHTVHVITVLTTRRLWGARGTRCIRGRNPVVESVAVMVSGGGATAGPGSSHRDSELIAPHSLSFSGPFHLCFLSLCMYITRITLCHVLFNPSSSSCSYSLLPPSSLGPRLRLIYSFRTLTILIYIIISIHILSSILFQSVSSFFMNL